MSRHDQKRLIAKDVLQEIGRGDLVMAQFVFCLEQSKCVANNFEEVYVRSLMRLLENMPSKQQLVQTCQHLFEQKI